MSSPGCPLTVTRPDLVGCLNCRWLPSVTTNRHPSAWSRRITSRTFTATAYQRPALACQSCSRERSLIRRSGILQSSRDVTRQDFGTGPIHPAIGSDSDRVPAMLVRRLQHQVQPASAHVRVGVEPQGNTPAPRSGPSIAFFAALPCLVAALPLPDGRPLRPGFTASLRSWARLRRTPGLGVCSTRRTGLAWIGTALAQRAQRPDSEPLPTGYCRRTAAFCAAEFYRMACLSFLSASPVSAEGR